MAGCLTGSIQYQYGQGVSSANARVTFDAGVGVQFCEVLDPSESQTEFAIGWAYANMVGVFILSQYDCTLETNDATTPDDTINLKAGVPYVWHEADYNSVLFTADVTSVFLTNIRTDGTNQVDIRVMEDV